MSGIKKTIRFPKIDKQGYVKIYVGDKSHKELREYINDLPDMYRRGELGNIKSGSDSLCDKMDLGIEVEKKVKASGKKTLTCNEGKRNDIIDESHLKSLTANYNLPRIDEYCDKRIDGKTTPHVFGLGVISAETTAKILLSAQMQILDITHDAKIMSILNTLKSKKDTHNRIKVGRVKGRLVKELAGYVRYEKPIAPPIPQKTTINGKEYDEDDLEDIPEKQPISITDPFYGCYDE